ncbi:MAG: class D sortase [Clostridia bacterium]|nr:class D sortase [Clostridia bacterium]
MKKISVILISIGLIIALIPIAGRIYTGYRQSQLLKEWEEAAQDPVLEYEKLQSAFDTGTSSVDKPASPDNKYQKKGNTSAQTKNAAERKERVIPKKGEKPKPELKVIGTIEIKKINLKLPVFEGTGHDSLSVGAGHLKGSGDIGGAGNCVIAGHRNYTFARFFRRLDELQDGDQIVLYADTKKYIYEVYEQLIVFPDDISVLKGDKSDSILTLITCHPYYNADRRLIIRGKIIKK